MFTHLRATFTLALLAGLLAACSVNAPSQPAETPAAAGELGAPPLQAGYEAAMGGDFATATELLAPQAASDQEAAELLATVRLGLAMRLVAEQPGDAMAARRALDLVGLALGSAEEPTLQQALGATQGALVALLSAEDARLALEDQAAAGATPEHLAASARLLAERAIALANDPTRLPGAERVAAAGLLTSAATLAASGNEAAREEARTLCEHAAALVPGDPAALACLERLAPPSSAPARPTAQVAQAPRPAVSRPQPSAEAAPAYGVAQRKSFDGSGNSGQYASCIDVQVLGPAGPVGGAVIGINNGEHSYQNQTDAAGYAGRCGLGASTWSVVLFWAPGGIVKSTATTVYLSGAPEQRAAAVFQAQ
jgi:hypothetical protein